MNDIVRSNMVVVVTLTLSTTKTMPGCQPVHQNGMCGVCI